MYGVVLWSDIEDKKAVIWCEDHGDLAFYSGRAESALDGLALDAGDLVQFQISEGREMRMASNPRLVAEQQYPTIAQRLRANGAELLKRCQPSASEETGSNVIRFRPRTIKPRMASMA